MTLTIEELKYGAAIGDLGIDAVRAVCAEALANREAQPVGYIAEVSGNRVGVLRGLPMPDVGSLIYTAPPAPAVPEEMTGGIAMSKYKVKKSNYVQWVKGFNACRAAMLESIDKPAPQLDSVVTRHADQPVSGGYKLPDSVLVLLNHIEDVLDDENWNRISVKKWNAVTMLAAAPEGGN